MLSNIGILEYCHNTAHFERNKCDNLKRLMKRNSLYKQNINEYLKCMNKIYLKLLNDDCNLEILNAH